MILCIFNYAYFFILSIDNVYFEASNHLKPNQYICTLDCMYVYISGTMNPFFDSRHNQIQNHEDE